MFVYKFRLSVIKNLLPENPTSKTSKVLTHVVSHCNKVGGKTKRKRCRFCTSKRV